MPELPEVETVVQTLKHQMGNPVIKSVEVIYPRIIDNKTVDEFSKSLENQKFESYGRRGKFLLFYLTDYLLVAHLRMEGKFYYYKQNEQPAKHTHLVFQLDNGQLHYNDVRKFGRFYLYRKGEEPTCLNKLGFEPFDEALNTAYLKRYCRNNKTPIKTMLLDHSMICGIGNIYADEICYRSSLNPLRPACFLSENDWQNVIEQTREVLGEAIKAGGTTIRSYTSSLGVTGLFQQQLYVHTQQVCQCGNPITKIRVGGRGTYYCQQCQKDRNIVIGLTGTIGSGKSTVREIISEQYPVFSCDDANSEILNKEETIKALAEIMGCQPGIVDKKYIADVIFADSEMKKKVEEYLHGAILKEMKNWMEENKESRYLFAEVPLLFEAQWNRMFDYNVLVACPEEIIVERLKNDRGMSQQQIEARMLSQMPTEQKKQLSDYVIINDSSLSKLHNNVEKLLQFIVKLDTNRT